MTNEEDCRSPNLEWLRANGANYPGQWVALDGGELLASGPVFEDVAIRAKRMRPSKQLFIARCEPADAEPFAGW